MKVLKGLRLCASFLLMSSYCHLAASTDLLIKGTSPFIKRSLPSVRRIFGSNVPDIFSCLGVVTTVRMYSTKNNNNQVSLPDKGYRLFTDNSSALESKQLLKSLEALSNQIDSLLEKLQLHNGHADVQQNIHPVNGQFSSGSTNLVDKEEKRKLTRRLAVIKPMKLEDKDLAVSLEHLSGVETKYPSPRAQENLLPYQDSSETVSKMRDGFVNRIMGSVRTTHKINPQDVRDILDLYAALVFRPKEGITKVLNGNTNTGKSAIFNEVLAHAQSKQSDLEKYRKTYARLCEAFGKEAMGVVYQAAEEMIKEKKLLMIESLKKKTWKEMSWQDHISLIVEGANPLYPVQSNEVKKILELYAALINRPRDGITKVLNYQTDTGKSTIYGEVKDHITQRGSDLETYRNIYGRVERALNRESMQIIYRMIDERKYIPNHLEGERFTDDQSQKETKTSTEKPATTTFKSNEYTPALVTQNVGTVPTSLHTSNSSDPFLETEDGKYRISKKEQERLNRIYDLLPEYAGKSISSVLYGSTKNPSAFKAVQGAIEQIRQEALRDGDTTKMDFNYFRKLHWTSVRVTGKGGSKEKTLPEDNKYLHTSNFYDNFIETEISKKEQKRLNRMYGLLPEYAGKSITSVLYGSTKNPSAFKAVQGAIEQIRQEALREGDTTKIDLNYFQKLHEKSVRIKEKSLLENNKEKISIVSNNKNNKEKGKQFIKKEKK